MDLKQNPFSLYDFLGYFTPGAIFLYGFLAACVYVHPEVNILDYIATKLSLKRVEVYIPLVLAAYAIGHFLSFISSVTVERYSIWAIGYPSKYLLGLPHARYFATEEKRAIRCVVRTVIAIFLGPVVLLDWLLGAQAGLRDLYAKKLDSLLITALRNKIDTLMSECTGKPKDYGTASKHDFFRYAYHYAVEHAPNHLPKMQNYVALYGFLRTLTLLSVIFFWWLVWQAVRGTFTRLQDIVLLSASMVLCYVLFMAFVKFYRRFSLEALMALAVSYEKPN
ncbi:MAG: hypothetical protein ACREOW_15965 [Thermodesulfobacteriota bacterium]